MHNQLQNKRLIITGWTSWIGRASVIEAVKQWAQVVFWWRNKDHAQELSELLNTPSDINVSFVSCDVTDPDNVKRAVEESIQILGCLDGIFVNAGMHMVGNIEQTTLEERNKIIATDLTGSFLTIKYTIPHLKDKGGSIVINGSDQSLIGKWHSCAYGATKGALGQMTKSLAIDYAPHKIRVNCVCPGTIDTPLARGAMKRFADQQFWWDLEQGIKFLEKAQPIQRLGQPEEVWRLVCFLLSDQAPFMTGSLISIDGWYTAW